MAGVGRDLFRITLTGTGRVSGVQFRPGGFRPFWRRPVAELTGRRCPAHAARPPRDLHHRPRARRPGPVCPGTDDDHAAPPSGRGPLTAWAPRPRPGERRGHPTGRGDPRGPDACCASTSSPRGTTSRSAGCSGSSWSTSGVGPKWVIRRYRLQEAVEQAAAGPLNWAGLAADLGYSDQAHLVRDFTAVAGVSPAAYARSVH